MYLKISLFLLFYAKIQLLYHLSQVRSHFGIFCVIITVLPEPQNDEKGYSYE